jgi:16S rRNA A1518/A1519 N6-dimethyltransferase RsmA/KsgA/DIM1 with predicted DNA glycosylase/AP lyase activity
VAFGQRRKQFQRILRDAYHLHPEQIGRLENQLGIDLRERPETFSPEGFVELAREIARMDARAG